jgi:type II secretion system protein L
MDVPAPQGANVVVCLQGENIRTFQVDLPRKNRQRFLQSIPYVLEDKLLHGPEDYHFVPMTKEHDSGQIAVAVIAKEEFDKTISKISDKHWHVNLITADYIFIAEPDERQWILDITNSPALLRGNYPELGSALAGDITARLHPALRLALERSVTPPEKLQIRVSNEEQSEKINGWREDLNELGVQSEIIVDDKSRIDWLSRFPDPGMGVNFLTGNYKTASRKTKLFSQYAPAMVMTLLLLILILAQVVLDKDRVETEYEFLRAEM